MHKVHFNHFGPNQYLLCFKIDGQKEYLHYPKINPDNREAPPYNYTYVVRKDANGNLIIPGSKEKFRIYATKLDQAGMVHHTSVAADRNIICSGKMLVRYNVLKMIYNNSGHYSSHWKCVFNLFKILKRNNYLTNIVFNPTSGHEGMQAAS